MSHQIDDDAYIRRYLLGELSEEEHEKIERRLLSDEEFYQQVLIVEGELTYGFVSDELPEAEETSFRRHVLPVPERQEDVTFARALRKYVGENVALEASTSRVKIKRSQWLEALAAIFRRPIVALCLAATLLLAVVLSAWLATQNRRLRNQLAALNGRNVNTPPAGNSEEELASLRRKLTDAMEQLHVEQLRSEDLKRNLNVAEQRWRETAPPNLPVRTPSTPLASVLLTAGLSRDESGQTKTISIPPGWHTLPLQLDLGGNDHFPYRAVLTKVDGRKELRSWQNLSARNVSGRITVSLDLSTAFLSRGDYQIRLAGKSSAGRYEEIDDYYFRVVR
jgi:anti-sigma-K factor RskA